MRQSDYIITGQGIAGSVLALTLVKRGKRVVVIDEPKISSSSRIAAGIYNPFNTKWMLNTWRAHEITPVAVKFYHDAEKILATTFHHPRKILKIFSEERYRKMWEKACETKRELFAEDEIRESPFPGIIHAPFGCGVISGSGNVDAENFVAATKSFLQKNNFLLQEKFESEKLILKAEKVVYDDRIAAKVLISCEGIHVLQNPHFSFLPIKAVKGQLLHLRIPGLKTEYILNGNVYLLPIGDEKFICGATYEDDVNDETISMTAKDELLNKLKKFIFGEIIVEQQFAAVRPASRDRRPIAGRHPEHSCLAVMNGMGSKGILLSPWLAEKLADHLENGIGLPEEVNVRRD